MSTADDPLSQVVARALTDEAFKGRLTADPAAVLAAEGVALPEGVSLKVVEDTESVRHLVLPALEERALTDSALEGVAAGGWEDPCREGPCMDYVPPECGGLAQHN